MKYVILTLPGENNGNKITELASRLRYNDSHYVPIIDVEVWEHFAVISVDKE